MSITTSLWKQVEKGFHPLRVQFPPAGKGSSSDCLTKMKNMMGRAARYDATVMKFEEGWVCTPMTVDTLIVLPHPVAKNVVNGTLGHLLGMQANDAYRGAQRGGHALGMGLLDMAEEGGNESERLLAIAEQKQIEETAHITASAARIEEGNAAIAQKATRTYVTAAGGHHSMIEGTADACFIQGTSVRELVGAFIDGGSDAKDRVGALLSPRVSMRHETSKVKAARHKAQVGKDVPLDAVYVNDVASGVMNPVYSTVLSAVLGIGRSSIATHKEE